MDTILILLTALTFSVLVTPLVKRAALRTGLVSIPRSRDVHVTPVPLLGGAAIYIGVVLALFIVSFFHGEAYVRELFGIMLAASLMALTGLVDDRWGLSPLIKLIAQGLATLILIVGGTQVLLFQVAWLDWLLTFFWVIGITNALNFMDNMDGLSGGVATIAAAFFLLLAAMNTPPQVLVATMAAALMGACIGFLRYNWNPANIFMGDTGSLFIGLLLAVLAIKLRFPTNTNLVTWMVPVVVLGVLVLDMTLVVVSRLRRGVNPFTSPGKDHLSHRLVALGMNKREAVLTIYLIAGALGMVGTYLTRANLDSAIVVGVALLTAAGAAIWWLESYCPNGIATFQPFKIN